MKGRYHVCIFTFFFFLWFYFLLSKTWFSEAKKLRQQSLNYYFSKWVERQWLLLPKLLWTIGFWHGDWNLNSMKKSRKLSRPHYLMLSSLQSKKWVMSLHLCKQNSAPRPERDTDCPSACLYSPEMVTGQTAHFPWNWTKLGCAEWVRGAVLSERKGKISHGKGPWDQSRGPASQAEIGAGSWPPTKALFPQLSASSSSTPPTLPLRQSWTSVLQPRTFWAIQMNESNREGQHQASSHAWPLDWCSCGEFPDHFRLQWRFIICCTV